MSRAGRIVRTLAAIAAGAAGAYGAYAAAAWYRYGRLEPARDPRERDAALDAFIPAYEVSERHQIRVAAPAPVALAAARDLDLGAMVLPQALFALRARVLGSRPAAAAFSRGLIADMLALGWTLLADVPDREVVVGTVTRPWQADVAFRSVPAGEFAAFAEPGYVKIAVVLRAEALGPAEALLHTETRVATTDATARATFRRYWAAFSAGIVLLRLLLVRRARAEAERRWRRREA